MIRRDEYVYVGVDLHKAKNVAMMVDCYGDPLGKSMTFANALPAFGPWLDLVTKRAEGKGVVFGLEDVHGLGQALAKYLLSRGQVVKFVNAYMTKRERDEVNKTDRIDALAVARVTQKHVYTFTTTIGWPLTGQPSLSSTLYLNQ